MTALPVTINSSDMACPFTATAEGYRNAAHMRGLITFLPPHQSPPCNKVTLVMPLSHPHNQISHKRELISFLHKPLSWSDQAFYTICNAVQMREWLSFSRGVGGRKGDEGDAPSASHWEVSNCQPTSTQLQIGVKLKRRPAGERPRQAGAEASLWRQMSMRVFNGVELIHAGCNLSCGCGRRTKPELFQGRRSRYIDRHLLRRPCKICTKTLTDLLWCWDNDKLHSSPNVGACGGGEAPSGVLL